MIVRQPISLSAQDIEESLIAARSVLNAKWLETQHRLEPSDSLLHHLKSSVSAQFLIHGIRHGLPHEMHPIAEAVLVGQAIVDQYRKNKYLCGSNLVYLLASIRDIVKARHQILGFEDRIPRLQGSDWKATLYELLTAASYVETVKVQVLPEGASHIPDLELHFDPRLYAECKIKPKYEDDVVNFVEYWRRNALGHIAEYLKKVDAGFLVQIKVNNKHDYFKDSKHHSANGYSWRIL